MNILFFTILMLISYKYNIKFVYFAFYTNNNTFTNKCQYVILKQKLKSFFVRVIVLPLLLRVQAAVASQHVSSHRPCEDAKWNHLGRCSWLQHNFTLVITIVVRLHETRLHTVILFQNKTISCVYEV